MYHFFHFSSYFTALIFEKSNFLLFISHFWQLDKSQKCAMKSQKFVKK